MWNPGPHLLQEGNNVSRLLFSLLVLEELIHGTLGDMDGGVVGEVDPQADQLAALEGHGSSPFSWLLRLLAGVFQAQDS